MVAQAFKAAKAVKFWSHPKAAAAPPLPAPGMKDNHQLQAL